METRVHCAQLGPSLSSLPQMGSNYSKALDRICWRASMAGDFFGTCTMARPPSWVPSSSSMKPVLVVKNSRRKHVVDESQKCKVFVDGNVRLIRRRMSHGDDKKDGAVSGKTKVRSFVDEATAHSGDLELCSPSALRERDDREAGGPGLDSVGMEPDVQSRADGRSSAEVNDRNLKYEENAEYGQGVTIIEGGSTPSVHLDYNYEDMKFGEKKNWSIADMRKLDLLRNFDYWEGSEKGGFIVQAMRVEHMKVTEELLVDSFAELMGGLLTYRPLLALTVQQYMRDRYACLPDAVTLVGLYAPAEDNVAMARTEYESRGNWLLAGTVELSFSNIGYPDIPAGPAPPSGSPYLCNMAVSSAYRRRGLGRQLLKAAEELAVLMGAQDLYLHCRMVDIAPLNMYEGAGYQIVATDSILSLLSFQRRRHLMRKRLQTPTPISTIQ